MAIYKTVPEISCVCYPLTAIPKRNFSGYLIGDILGDVTTPAIGDSSGIQYEASANPTVSIDWFNGLGAAGGQLFDVNGVQFVRFMENGQFIDGNGRADGATMMSGFILNARLALLDCKVGSTAIDTGHTDLNFTAQQGTWKTGPAIGGHQATRVMNTGADDIAIIKTTGALPLNRSFSWGLRFSQLRATGATPQFRGIWASYSFSLNLLQGSVPTIDRYRNGAWEVWKTLEGAPPSNLAGGHYSFAVRRIAGYLVISLNGRSWWMQDFVTDDQGKNTPIDATWASGSHFFAVQNARVSASIATIKYSTAAGVAFAGQFSRALPSKRALTGYTGTARTAGWKRGGVSVTATPTVISTGVQYTCLMVAGPDGIDTPFVSKVLCRFGPAWTTPVVSGVDISPAVTSVRISKARPPIMSGAQMAVEVDRNLLLQRFVALGYADWSAFVGQYHPIELQVRWHYSDGTTGAWTKLFKGYIVLPAMSSPGASERGMSLACRDGAMRLENENNRVDYKYPPLDYVFAFLGESDPLGNQVFGADCVKEILGIAVGPSEADALNGGQLMRYFSEDHYPLISSRNDTAGYFAIDAANGGQPPTGSKWKFPPPYRSDVLTWIKSIAKIDGGEMGTVFYYGWPGGYVGDWAVPIYGRYLYIIGGRTPIIIPDDEYLAGDIDKLLQSVNVERRPDRNINRVLAYAAGAPDIAEGINIPRRLAEARLPTSDQNAEEKTWQRTLELDVEMGVAPGMVETVAQNLIRLLRGRDMDFPDVTLRGMATLDWGDKIQLKLENACSSDLTIALSGVTFRVEQVEHVITLGATPDFTTSLKCIPLSALGW